MADKTRLEGPISIDAEHDYPLYLDMIFNNIGPENCEDALWQNLIDNESEIVEDEIGICVTQSYQYTKLHEEPTIIARWQGIKTAHGNEFRIGLGVGESNNKNTPPILKGSFLRGIESFTPIKPGPISELPSVKYKNGSIGMYKGTLAVYMDGKWHRIQLGDPIE